MGDRLRNPLLLAAAILAAIGAAVLYGMLARVHAVGAPPPAISRLKLAEKPLAVPGVAFTDAKGGRHILSQFKGRYVLLNLWATWCTPCVEELPALAQLQSEVPQITVVAVNVGRATPAETAAFLKAHKAARLAVYDDTDVALVRAFKAYGLPLSVLIDPESREIGRAEGPGDWNAPEAAGWFKALAAQKHA